MLILSTGVCCRDNERLVRLRDEDRILMFEVESPAPSTEEELPVRYGFLYHRMESTLVGDPLLFTFNAATTCLEYVPLKTSWVGFVNAHLDLCVCAELFKNGPNWLERMWLRYVAL